MQSGELRLETFSFVKLATTLKTSEMGGVVFDAAGEERFKFAALLPNEDRLVIGHYTTKSGWVYDAETTVNLNPNKDAEIELALKGTTISVSLDGQLALSYSFNAVLVDGGFGLLARDGMSSFASVTVSTDDPAFLPPENTENLISNAAPTGIEQNTSELTTSALSPIVDEAISRWLATGSVEAVHLEVLETMNVEVVDLSGMILGQVQGDTVSFDVNAAGYGWFVDTTPDENSEFRFDFAATEYLATPDSSAYGYYDLLTVAIHEVGHLIGFGHSPDGTGVMGASLTPSSRRLLESSGLDSTQNSDSQLSAEILVRQNPPILTNTDAAILQQAIDDTLANGPGIGNLFATTAFNNATLFNRPDRHQIPHPATALSSSTSDEDSLFQAFIPLPAVKRLSKLFDHDDSKILSDQIENAGEDAGDLDDLFAAWEKQLVDGVLGITTGVLE